MAHESISAIDYHFTGIADKLEKEIVSPLFDKVFDREIDTLVDEENEDELGVLNELRHLYSLLVVFIG